MKKIRTFLVLCLSLLTVTAFSIACNNGDSGHIKSGTSDLVYTLNEEETGYEVSLPEVVEDTELVFPSVYGGRQRKLFYKEG